LQPWRGPTSSRLAIRLAPTARIPIPNIKPASRAADRADQLLNDSYKKLQDAVRADAKDMGQSPEVQLGYLKDAQKQWIAYRDASCTFDDSLAFGGTSIGGNYSSCLCAFSYERINDFERIEKAVMGSP
jgi:uncharacterized protein YecT (DUF1311 family)